MQYFVPALVALAIGANAAPAPHWDYPKGFGGPVATGGAFPSGLVPTGTGLVPFPTAPPSYKSTNALARADDDDEEEEEEDSDSSSSAKASGTKSAKSTKSSKGSSSTKSSDDSSASEEATATASSAPATTSAPSSNSGSSGSGGSLPASSGTSALSAVQTIAAGESFDGGMVAYDRGVDCTGQSEGGDSDAVFYLEAGASLSNVIIGPNQIEGVHCFGECTLTNVWWSAVCEDAFTIKEQEAGATTTITGGGAFGAEDKVLQHNGGGTLSVSGFTVEGFGKLYRSCGNCKTMYERHVIFDDVTASEGKSLAGINSNYGDTATFTNVVASGVSDICVEYKGNDTGDEPEEISSGPSSACIYTTSDVTSS
ncbi:Putative pectate lyase PlyH/PlyE, pectin lyase/virulence factor [Septoria linicola]|uniref:Pectate lyase n=1 Tax=Septoria linicola TaxID=215465 RepID=A0A9Q9EEI9_9PEZI|nr:putative pectate lyase PlyH/PlyE, pectin lyase/virulence factor [Septoria linicola]USW46964.1 Putative pectate lyase PlyH/PlyE, pectin lyase/virulence factor [Septoria linicola]